MSKQFPDNIFLQGIWEPLRAESDIYDPIVIGNIPGELNGTFFRNGPNPQYVYSKNYHLFEGDGMLHAMTFVNGNVKYANRWLRTEKFLVERKARKSLFGGMRDLMVCDDSVKNCPRNTANTNIVWHHDRLLALNEGGQPQNVDIKHFGNCKPYDFQSTFHRSMTAHPKIDSDTGELLFYSYLSPMLDFMYYVSDKQGKIIHSTKLDIPYTSLVHDFAITEHFSIFPFFPLTWDYRRIQAGETVFKWEPGLNSRFAVIPRYGNNDQVIWFETEACLGMHVINAYENGDRIILEMVIMDEIPDTAIAYANDDETFSNYLTRFTFDLRSGSVSRQRLDSTNSEFPRIDERYTGKNYRFAFVASTQNEHLSKNLFDSITCYDRRSDCKQVHYFGDDSLALEPIFVPANSLHEGHGYLLSYVYRKRENRSDLVILDAMHVEAEPVCVIQLPHRIPYGFHGCWVPHLDM